MPPAALILCMYARTVSRSTDESIGPLMSKKPPIVILPPLAAPPPGFDAPAPAEVVVVVEPGVEALWPPDAPCPLSATDIAVGCVNERTVMAPRMQATTTEAAVRETATRARVSRATTWKSSRPRTPDTQGK